MQSGGSAELPAVPSRPRIEITEESLASEGQAAAAFVGQPTVTADGVQTSPVVASLVSGPARLVPVALPPAKATDRAVGGCFCSGCGHELDPRAVMCPHCGVATPNAIAPVAAAAALAANHKSPGIAMVLSLVFTGAGQVYCGRAARGIAFFAAAFVSAILIFAVVGLVLLPIVWIWAMIDAYQLASKQNQLLIAGFGGGTV